MTLRTLIRVMVTVLGICAAGVLVLNVETLATRLGYQAVLADALAPESGRSSALWQFLSSTPVVYAAVLVLGISIGAWIVFELKKRQAGGKSARATYRRWDTCYRKVRAMQKKLSTLRDAQTDQVPEDLPYEILSLHASLRRLGIPTPDRDRTHLPAGDYFRENWAYLNCIAPFMRDEHKREARASAKRYLRTAKLIESPGFQRLLGIEP